MQSESAIRDHLAEAERRRDGWLQRMLQSGLTPLERGMGAGGRTMSNHIRSTDDAFEEWEKTHVQVLGQVHWILKSWMHDAFTAGWHGALAAQEQAHAEATRRIEEGMR